MGAFISPDTLVPDATNLFSYNRYMYGLGNPLKYNDPSGHCEKTIGDDDYECLNLAQTIYRKYPGMFSRDDLERTRFDHLQRTYAELQANPPMIEDESLLNAAKNLLEQAALVQLHYDGDGNIDVRTTLETELGEALGLCGQAIGGVCGVSYTLAGGGITPVNGKFSTDFYADQDTQMAAYATVSGGGSFVPSVVSVDVTGLSVMVMRGADVDNVSKWGGQFGGSSKVVGGPAIDWIVVRDGNRYLHGVSIGGNGGAGVEIHANLTYSLQLYHSR